MAKTILDLEHEKAREFLLREESYNSVKFPPYIKFDSLIEKISAELNNNSQIYKKNAGNKNIYPSSYVSGFTTLFPTFKNHTPKHIRLSDKQIRLQIIPIL
jgi:hypothetical protein